MRLRVSVRRVWLFVEFEEAGVVEVGAIFFVDEGFPLGAAVVEGGGVEAEGVGKLADEADVFELECGAAAGGEVAADHAVAMEVEDAAFGEAAEEGLANEGGIDAGEFGESEGLGDGVDGLGDDELVGEFGDLASAGVAHVGDVLADGLQKGEGALEVGGGAAGHDGEVAGFGADLATGDGGVDPMGFGSEGFGFGDAGGAEVDDEGVGVEGIDEATGAEYDLLDDGGGGEVDAEDAGADLAGEVGQGGGAFHAEGDGGFCGGVAAIPDDDFSAGFMEVAGVGAAHVAKAGEADFLSEQGRVHEMW
jgi:hypothetical protein